MDPITEESVRHSVSKDSTDRLKNELINFQDVLDPSQISVLSRDKLIDLVVVLRLMHNSTESVKIMTKNFDPKKAKFELAKLKGSVEISSAGGAEGGADVMNLLLSLMQSMTQQRQDEAKQRLEEITRREKREDDLRMLLEKKESEKQIELHKQELERQFELNRREVEKQLELDKKELERKVEADKIIADQLLEKERMDKILEQEREARHRKDEALFDSIKALQAQHVEKMNIETTRFQTENSKREVRLTKIRKALAGVITPMPKDFLGAFLYLKRMEEHFLEHKIENDLKIAILTPYVNESIKRMIESLPLEQRDTYDKWKSIIVRWCRITPKLCRLGFNSAIRTSTETHIQYACRLKNLFNCYLESKEIKDSFEDLVSLIVSDRYKQTLATEDRMYLSDKESDKARGIFDLALCMDDREIERGYRLEKQSVRYNQWKGKGNFVKNKNGSGTYNNGNSYHSGVTTGGGSGTNGGGVNKSNNFVQNKVIAGNRNFSAKPGNVNKERSGNYNNYKSGRTDNFKTNVVEVDIEETGYEDNSAEEDFIEEECEDNDQVEEREINKVEVCKMDGTCVERPRVKASLLNKDHHVLVENKLVNKAFHINFGKHTVLGICDSGSEISVIRRDWLVNTDEEEGESASVVLQGAFHDGIKAQLRNVEACLVVDEDEGLFGEKVLITCAVTNCLKSAYALITTQDYATLLQQNKICRPKVCVDSSTNKIIGNDTFEQEERVMDRLEVNEIEITSVKKGDKLLEESLKIDFEKESNEDLVQMQKSDQSLAKYWSSAKHRDKNETKIFVNEANGLLYRHTRIGGIEVNQLVLPVCKRQMVIDTGHDSIWSMHLARDKTLQRLQLYFFWPGMKMQIEDYIKRCDKCQKKQELCRMTK